MNKNGSNILTVVVVLNICEYPCTFYTIPPRHLALIWIGKWPYFRPHRGSYYCQVDYYVIGIIIRSREGKIESVRKLYIEIKCALLMYTSHTRNKMLLSVIVGYLLHTSQWSETQERLSCLVVIICFYSLSAALIAISIVILCGICRSLLLRWVVTIVCYICSFNKCEKTINRHTCTAAFSPPLVIHSKW